MKKHIPLKEKERKNKSYKFPQLTEWPSKKLVSTVA